MLVEHRRRLGNRSILFPRVGLVAVAVDGSIAADLVATETPLCLLHRAVLCLGLVVPAGTPRIQRTSFVIAREGVINVCNL